MAEPKLIMRTMVGSRAHGTSGPNSDYDIRSVVLQPTRELLAIGSGRTSPNRDEFAVPGEKMDVNSWELGRFLELSTKGNPTTLEVLLAPAQILTEEGQRLRDLFPALLNKRAIFGAFRGFAQSERRTMLSPNSGRCLKSMSHYLRVMYNGIELLRTGTMTVKIMDTPIGCTVLQAKRGELTAAEALRIGEELERQLEQALAESPLPEKANLDVVNEFLLEIRQRNW